MWSIFLVPNKLWKSTYFLMFTHWVYLNQNFYILQQLLYPRIGEGLKNHHIGSISVQAPYLLVSYYSYSLDETETGRPFNVLLCCTFSKNIIHSNVCALSSVFLVSTWPLNLNICCYLGEWMRCRKGACFFLLVPNLFHGRYHPVLPHFHFSDI